MTIPINRSPDQSYIDLMDKKIGDGTSRQVYSILACDDYVIKFNEEAGANEKEANFYDHASKLVEKDVVDSLGKVLSISETGKYLVMEKLEDVSQSGSFNVTIPKEIGDFKRSNFGEVDNKIKLRDYALQESALPSGEVTQKTIPSRTEEQNMRDIAGLLDGLL
ncbi:conserved hypothetical protein [Vibrio owensii]|nr:conserved hypothetical protein [Vibrio owensii]